MHKFIWYLYVFLSIGSIFELSAQKPVFRNLTVNDGLTSNFIKCIYKDRSGFIWIGTLEGLNRFDGTEIKSYSIEPGGIPESVNAILQSNSSRLLIGTDAGLFELNLLTEIFTKLTIESLALKITVLVQEDSESVLIGSDKGLYRYKQGKFQVIFRQDPQSLFNSVTGIIADKEDFWISTLGGLVRVDKKNRSYEIHDDFRGFYCITSLKNKLYLGSKNKGLWSFDIHSGIFSSIPAFNDDIVLTLNSGNKCIFAGTDGNGLKIFDPVTAKIESIQGNENSPFSLSSSSVYSFLFSNDIYWIGTYSGGLNYSISSKKLFDVKTFGTNFLTYNKSIRSFYFAANGDVLIGGRNGFYFYDHITNNVVEYSGSGTSNLRSNIILTIFPFENNYLLGTYGGGVSVFNSKKRQFYDFLAREEFKSGSVYQFAPDSSGNLWIATLNGVYCYNIHSNKIDHYTSENSGIFSDETYSIKIDSRKRIWVGTMKGACILIPGGKTFRTDLFPSDFNNKFRITNFSEDYNGNMWVSTEKGGLFKISSDLKKVVNFSVHEGLPDNAICATIQDKHGNIWISTLNGFCKIDASSSLITSYEISDGLPGKVFNPSAVSLLQNGMLVWGNEKGMVSFFPDSAKKMLSNAPVRFTTFYLGGKEVKAGNHSPLKNSIETTREIELSHNQNSIGFRFIALNYLNEKDNRYVYKLEGLENDWQSAGNRNTAFYNDLNPGKYVFKAKLLGGEDPKVNGQITIIVKRSFFKTPIFYVLVLLAIGFSGFLIYNRFRFIKNKLRLLTLTSEKKIQEKSKALRMSDNEGNEVKRTLLHYMEKQKPFLNINLKLTDVSKETGYSVHEISHVLNQMMQTSFSDFVNNYRVSECKARMLDEKYAKFTLTAIAEQCGFNSKASFYRAFKKVTNTTPAEYFKDYKNR